MSIFVGWGGFRPIASRFGDRAGGACLLFSAFRPAGFDAVGLPRMMSRKSSAAVFFEVVLPAVSERVPGRFAVDMGFLRWLTPGERFLCVFSNG
ncbi:MAG: hypothetical protein DIU65_01965 [Proteobacteria bacterium]|nr:MAG: hypothetical protein DIU65_01965 [Pseudomonadota bacterium]